MSSLQYNTYKFRYTDDLGRTVIKRQRAYLNDNDTEDTPITPLFLARVVNFEEKVTGTSQGLRHVLAYVGERELKANIPYEPTSTEHQAHIEEILADNRVICGDYVGERLITGGSTNSI